MGAADRDKSFESAERLLRSGKVPSALDEFRRLADDSPRDLQMLNRIGDSLARAGRNSDAIAYYERIADQFAAAGFYPKAVAILKKVTRIDPDRAETLIRLGEFHVKQKLNVEAKSFLLRAGEVLFRGGKTQTAREVYSRLVAADPGDTKSRLRFAESCAAAGDPAAAVEELLAAAGPLAAAGRTEEAIQAYRRATEIAPTSPGAVAALAAYLASTGRDDDAVAVVEAAVARHPSEAPLRAEWLLVLERAGEGERVRAFLESQQGDALADAAIERALREALAAKRAEAFWDRIDVLLARWGRSGQSARATELLERLAAVEPRGHVPALERLLRDREREGDSPGVAGAIERLLMALRDAGDTAKVAALREALRAHDPASPSLIEDGGEVEADGSTAAPAPASPSRSPAESRAPSGSAVPLRIEAPPVPLSPADQEFVAGHLTEADVFQKYRLFAEALQQVREAVRRFPGHLPALERLLELTRAHGSKEDLRDGLVETAWAKRAAGDETGAKRALEDARDLAGLSSETVRFAQHLGLLPETAAQVAPEVVPAAIDRSEVGDPAPASVDAGDAARETEDEWVIEFDGDDGTGEESDEAPPLAVETEDSRPTPPTSSRVVSRDVLDEIEAAVARGDLDEAARKIDALRLLGFGGQGLDAVEARLGENARPRTRSQLDDDDLSTITAALEAESVPATAPEDGVAPEGEQSLEEVFGAFKRHVDQTVGADDFRTRYDLGIAYKEMGLLEDAIEEFRAASKSSDHFREACTMLGLCHRERGEYEDAVRWYRQALEGEDEEPESLRGVRYDLAEVLLERGDREDALALFREVLDADPSYRDVRRYVHELQAKSGG